MVYCVWSSGWVFLEDFDHLKGSKREQLHTENTLVIHKVNKLRGESRMGFSKKMLNIFT